MESARRSPGLEVSLTVGSGKTGGNLYVHPGAEKVIPPCATVVGLGCDGGWVTPEDAMNPHKTHNGSDRPLPA